MNWPEAFVISVVLVGFFTFLVFKVETLEENAAAHEKEVADLKQRIEELEAQLQDDRKEPSHDWR